MIRRSFYQRHIRALLEEQHGSRARKVKDALLETERVQESQGHLQIAASYRLVPHPAIGRPSVGVSCWDIGLGVLNGRCFEGHG